MNAQYVESIPQFGITDLLDEIIMNAETVKDASTHSTYLKIGCGFDIETSKIETETVLTAYCYHWQFSIGENCFMGRTLETMKTFVESVIDSIARLKNKSKLLVLDANLGYEWQFCKHYWAEIGITKLFAKEKRNPLQIELESIIEFREVIGLFGRSLAQIAKNYCGIEKLVGDLDYDKVRLSNTPMTDEEIGYCIRDVEILSILGTKIFNEYFGKKPKLPYTSTGIVRNEIKRRIPNLKETKNDMSEIMPTELEYECFRKYLFKGGICGCNIMLMDRVLKNVKGADITSDYPYQIFTKFFPMGKCELTENKNFMKEEKPYIVYIRFHKFRTKSAHALMSAHKAMNSTEMIKNPHTVLDNNRIQYAENVELIINDIEFKSLKKAYKWKKAWVKKCWVFNDGYSKLPSHVIKTCLEKYLEKESLKAEKSDTQEYKDAKAFVNSIFGMMCTALFREEWKFDSEKCDIIIEEDENGNKIVASYEDACKNLFLSPYWGFWITSYAREMLIDVITKFPKIIVQYDTDSVYYLSDTEEGKKLEEYLKLKNMQMESLNGILFKNNPHMKSIGTWDFTEPFKRFKGLGSKRYMYEKQNGEIKVVVTGCRKVQNPQHPYFGKSTIELQCDLNNQRDGTNIDIFDFFSNHMKIEAENSFKLASKYIEEECVIDYTDYLGRSEKIICKSAVVLIPIEFNMGIARKHLALNEIAKRYSDNGKDWRAYNLWKELKKLGI